MNKHFEDTQYYLKRAGSEAKRGIKEELEPVQERVERLAGNEDEPEEGRLDSIKSDLKKIQGRAEGEAKEAIGEARERVEALRQKRAAE
ncbi:hypothetical protein GJ629_05845 [Halapricum sp. CBA1109]|uniref:DUF7553 family protein n=1 Tax=Halapricum sp. CBA1109 TaxID=2668068 RepID=UPI0012F8BE3F|nr:hypothetical protein [Halapricum sp. CBA1109]MUV89476.1 hypothetical protein [Halapricum sp. CBA1109]